MKDTIIKGTGNSRTLKTVPNALTLYSDFPAMMQAMIDGTFPIDIGPLNLAGVDVEGTALSKENLLKDATAALYGKGADAVPDDIFAAIRSLITTAQNTANNALNTANGKVKIEAGSYRGNDSTSKTFNFSITPKIVFLACTTSSGGSFVLSRNSSKGSYYTGSSAKQMSLSWSDSSLTISSSVASPSWNANNYNYIYVAIG